MNLTIVLPTYNEAQNLPPMMRALLALPLRERLRVLIVDDNSPDGTGRIADELARQYPGTVAVLHRRHKEGLGPAYVAGFTQALADGADLILQMDCDFSHRPEDIPALLAAAEDADVVLGSRFCPGGEVDRAWGTSRKLLSRFANSVYVRATLGLPIHDATGGFRLWRREALLGIDPGRRVTLSGYGFQVEMALLAHRLGCRIKEVPIYFPERTRGDSKMSISIMAEAALQVPRLRWRHRAPEPPVSPVSPVSPEPPVRSRASSDSNHAAPLPWMPTIQRRSLLLFMLLLALMFILSMVAMASVPLIPEEAYYWMYAEHSSLSYYDHPPMVAWVIGLGTAVFGDTQFGVRIVGNLLMLGASLLMYRFGREWFSRAAGLVSALLLQVLPMYFGVGFIATMDSALLFFWMLCLVGVSAALRRNHVWGWYLAGFALGAAMLSKYTGVFLAAGTVLAVIAHRPWRRHLLTAHPYLAFLLAAAMFSPVIIWNAQHDWASFRFQFLDRFGSKPLNLETMLIFIGIQFMVATPFVLWLSAALIPRLLRGRRFLGPRWLIALSFSLPLLLVMAYKSLRYEVHINWTLPVFLSLLPAVSQMFIAQMRRLRGCPRGRTDLDRRRWARQLTRTAMVCVLINIGISAYLLVLQPRLQLIAVFGPWEPLAQLVEEYEDRLEYETGREPLIVADGKYRLASLLAFYRTPIEHDAEAADYTTSQWILGGNGLAYPYWIRREDWYGRDCLYIENDADDDILAETAGMFDSVELVDDVRLRALGRGKYRIAVCRGLGLTTPKSSDALLEHMLPHVEILHAGGDAGVDAWPSERLMQRLRDAHRARP